MTQLTHIREKDSGVKTIGSRESGNGGLEGSSRAFDAPLPESPEEVDFPGFSRHFLGYN